MRNKVKMILLVYVCFIISLNAQSPDAEKIINKAKEKINKVEDYSAEVVIKVDVNFLKVPETIATIYFKKPDKVKMNSDGFALLPKQGFNFSPMALLQEDYSAVYTKEDSIAGNAVYLIKIIPLSDSSNVVLSNLYVDKEKFIVRKIETTTKTSGTVTLNLDYGKELEYGLPSVLTVSFEVSQMKLPSGMRGEEESGKESKKKNSISGSVTVEYKNYKINQGLSDEFFEEENSE